MRDCLELMGEIVAIHILPVGELKFSVPFNALKPSYTSSEIKYEGHNLTNDLLKTIRGIAIDTYYNTIPEGSIKMEPGSSVKESGKISLTGNAYTTKISSKSYDPIDDIRYYINDMSSLPSFDVVVVDSLERVFILRGSEPSTSISMSAVLPLTGTHSIEVNVVSVNGLIPVIFEED